MLIQAMSLLLAQLNQYVRQADGNPPGTPDVAILGNISQLDDSQNGAALQNQVVMTLVNLEEETVLKNRPAVTREPSGTVSYQNPALYLNLFLLFTANFSNYETALRRVDQIVLFFQGKKKFTLENSPDAGLNVTPGDELSLTMDLLSLTFEEVNNLWGSLGGKQMPFVIYRCRLVRIKDRRVLEGGGHVREIELASRDTHA